ncbi:MAG: hypothetical protein IPL81_16625 [Flavobacteriales bacterium]|nr:hypothetical protein [Flavobacteriales bacterium]
MYEGTCDGLQCIGGNDDGGGCGFGSQLTFATWDGGEYLVLVQGYNGATGTFTLSVDCQEIRHDECYGALPISCGETLEGSTAGATPDDNLPCQTSLPRPPCDMWPPIRWAMWSATTCPDQRTMPS